MRKPPTSTRAAGLFPISSPRIWFSPRRHFGNAGQFIGFECRSPKSIRDRILEKKEKGWAAVAGQGCRDRNRPAACANFVFSLIALMAGTLFYQGG
jgi:hypothetical protein